MQNRFKLYSIFILISLILTGCNHGLKPTSSNIYATPSVTIDGGVLDKGPVKGGRLRLFSSTLDTLNPILTKNRFYDQYLSLVFESLISLDNTGKPKAGLSDSWKVSTNGLEWMFHMRQGVYWHGGEAFTAYDAEYSMKLIMSSFKDKNYSPDLNNIYSFSAINRSTLRILLKAPDYFTPEKLTFPIVKQNSFDSMNPNNRNQSSSMLPEGTGPYRIASYDSSKSLKLEANSQWWYTEKIKNNDNRPPYITYIDVLIENQSSKLIDDLKKDKIDLISTRFGEYGRYTGRANLSIKGITSRNMDYLVFNMNKAPFVDVALRKAVSEVINIKNIKENILQNEATEAEMPIIPESWIYTPSVNNKEIYINNVLDYLSKNGWKDYGSGYYKYVNGKYCNTDFIILVNQNNSKRCAMADYIAYSLKKAGLNPTVKKLSGEEYNNSIQYGYYDCALTGCRVPETADMTYFFTAALQGGNPYLGNSNYYPQNLQNALNTVKTSNDDFVRKSAFRDAINILETDVPFKALVFYNDSFIYHKKIKITYDPSTWSLFQNAPNWYIPG